MSTDTLPPPIHESNGHAVRLNVGGGNTHLTGFLNVDRKDGQEAYPLAQADNSVEEIYASHVLEHFSHRDAGLVLEHWFQKLRPGGKIRLAVPDFGDICNRYQAGEPINVQGYVMGGQTDLNDFHRCIFDRESLTELMIRVGFERIGPWQSDAADCSALPISLNLQGFKPSGPEKRLANVRACGSTPRYGPLLHPKCKERAFQRLGIECTTVSSCYWHQQISNLMDELQEDDTCEFILTLDFDTVFEASDVLELYRLMKACPEADAIFPLQSKRGCELALFNMKAGELDVSRNLVPVDTGHFGLTLLRVASLRRFPRPWMVPRPAPDGRWMNGQTDADIDFWLRFKACGFKAFLAPRVVVGHLEDVVTWPGKDLRPIHQRTGDYEEVGIPAEVAR